ncbi:MAG: hypothetical protein EBR07_11385 [Planctomycetes bacterium]|nr:hypothetical protein [Planctomycetota bacterium]
MVSMSLPCMWLVALTVRKMAAMADMDHCTIRITGRLLVQSKYTAMHASGTGAISASRIR